MARSTMIVRNNHVLFTMHVGGQDVDINGGIYIDVDIDYTGANNERVQMYASGGSSLRVKLQTQLRSMDVKALELYGIKGLQVPFNDIDSGVLVGKSRSTAQATDIFTTMTLSEVTTHLRSTYTDKQLSNEKIEELWNVRNNVQ